MTTSADDEHAAWLECQQEIVARERALRAQEQVTRWKTDSLTLLQPRFRFVSLLQEAARHEISTIQDGRSSRPHSISDPSMLVRDLKGSYRLLLKEAHKLFQDRAACGLSHDELHGICSQATSSFAALYPWSDGTTCRDLTVGHPHFIPLATQRMITAGDSGVITLKTFIASYPCAEVKQEAALARRKNRIDMYELEKRADRNDDISTDEHGTTDASDNESAMTPTYMDDSDSVFEKLTSLANSSTTARRGRRNHRRRVRIDIAR